MAGGIAPAAQPLNLSGSMTFVYQDGTSTEVFTYTGQLSGSSATLTPFAQIALQ